MKTITIGKAPAGVWCVLKASASCDTCQNEQETRKITLSLVLLLSTVAKIMHAYAYVSVRSASGTSTNNGLDLENYVLCLCASP